MKKIIFITGIVLLFCAWIVVYDKFVKETNINAHSDKIEEQSIH